MALRIVAGSAILLAVQAFAEVRVPDVILKNAAVPGLRMPAVGLGTGAYMFAPRTGPGEIWNDTTCKQVYIKLVDAVWLPPVLAEETDVPGAEGDCKMGVNCEVI